VKWLDAIKGGVRRMFGREQDDEPRVVSRSSTPFRRQRYDAGPVEAKYLKAKLPRSAFTKPMNRHRVKEMQRALVRLRPEQREFIYARGWNKGVIV